jgi:hypothetical protein
MYSRANEILTASLTLNEKCGIISHNVRMELW